MEEEVATSGLWNELVERVEEQSTSGDAVELTVEDLQDFLLAVVVDLASRASAVEVQLFLVVLVLVVVAVFRLRCNLLRGEAGFVVEEGEERKGELMTGRSMSEGRGFWVPSVISLRTS